jgi:exonuclease VII large subunit
MNTYFYLVLAVSTPILFGAQAPDIQFKSALLQFKLETKEFLIQRYKGIRTEKVQKLCTALRCTKDRRMIKPAKQLIIQRETSKPQKAKHRYLSVHKQQFDSLQKQLATLTYSEQWSKAFAVLTYLETTFPRTDPIADSMRKKALFYLTVQLKSELEAKLGIKTIK